MPRERAARAADEHPQPTGTANARQRFFGVARRQAITGPTPIRNSSAMPSGAFTRLKNGGPTVIFTPRTHSEMHREHRAPEDRERDADEDAGC